MIEVLFLIMTGWTISGAWDENPGYAHIEFEAQQAEQVADLPTDAAEHLRKLSTLNAYPRALASRPSIPTARHSRFYAGKIGGCK